MSVTNFQSLEKRLEKSLKNHLSLDENKNPVLVRVMQKEISFQEIVWVLEQYTILPRRIVQLLKMVEESFKKAGKFEDAINEVRRNVEEEKGSRTEGISHYEILKRLFAAELNLNIDQARACSKTDSFIKEIQECLVGYSALFEAGAVYALECSVIPELEILAKIINEYGRIIGQKSDLIRISDTNRASVKEIHQKKVFEYSLEDFIFLHLHDFELGHKLGLWKVFKRYLQTHSECDEFEKGFEKVLCVMDEWWRNMAKHARIFLEIKKIEQSNEPDVYKRRKIMRLLAS